MFWGRLSEILLYRASEVTTFVNTCRLLARNNFRVVRQSSGVATNQIVRTIDSLGFRPGFRTSRRRLRQEFDGAVAGCLSEGTIRLLRPPSDSLSLRGGREASWPGGQPRPGKPTRLRI